jgi:hypothetical protein
LQFFLSSGVGVLLKRFVRFLGSKLENSAHLWNPSEGGFCLLFLVCRRNFVEGPGLFIVLSVAENTVGTRSLILFGYAARLLEE